MAAINFIIQAIQQLDPNAGWDIFSETDVRVLNSSITMDDVVSLASDLESQYQQLKYADQRGKSYPSITSQLDMLWHMMDDETMPGKGSVWYNTIKDVKEQYPKPE